MTKRVLYRRVIYKDKKPERRFRMEFRKFYGGRKAFENSSLRGLAKEIIKDVLNIKSKRIITIKNSDFRSKQDYVNEPVGAREILDFYDTYLEILAEQ